MKPAVVGLIFLVAIVLLVAGTIFIGKLYLASENFVLEVNFADAVGLIKGDEVKVEGVEMGRVSSIKLRPGGVRVRLALNEPVELYDDYKIAIEQTSLVGGYYVLIRRGKSGQKADLTNLQGSNGEMREMMELFRVMMKSMKENEIIPKMSKIIESLSKFLPK